MKRLFAVLLCLMIPVAVFAADNTYKVTYDGGSIPGAKVGSGARLSIEQTEVRLLSKGADVVEIPVSSITEISYGQDVHRRVGAAIGIGVFTLGVGALMALTKSKKHYVGLTWVNGDKKGGFVMQCSKNDYRGILLGLEGVTGEKSGGFRRHDGEELTRTPSDQNKISSGKS